MRNYDHHWIVQLRTAPQGLLVVSDPFHAAAEVGPLAHTAQFDKVRELRQHRAYRRATFAIGAEPLKVEATDGSGYFHELTTLTA